jgi:NarL family two-component system response regulator LiaR
MFLQEPPPFRLGSFSNSQIAEKLAFSENTVKGHVSNILSKLHVADRTQVAVYAWQRGIVHREQ